MRVRVRVRVSVSVRVRVRSRAGRLRWMSRMTFLRCLARSRRKVSVRTRLRYLLTVRIRGLGSDPKPIPNQVEEEGEDQGAVTVLGVRVAERVELPP